MKKLLMVLMLLLGSINIASAQSYQRKGNNFEQTSSRGTSTSTQTQFTWTDSKDNTYPIFITKNGRCYINKVSAKTGKEYKFYLPEEASKEIAKEMGVPYTYVKKAK